MRVRSRIHPDYEFFFPCNQAVGTGTPIDVSGAGGTLFPGSGLTDAQMWANAGYVSTRAAANAFLAYSRQAFRRLWTTNNSFACHFTMKASAPASSQGIMGQGTTVGTITGWRLVGLQTSGDVRMDVYGKDNSAVYLTSSAKMDGADHHFFITGDGPNRVMTMAVDGTYVIPTVSNFDNVGDISSNESDFGLGIAAPVSGSTSALIQISGIGLLVFDGPLPDQIGRMAAFTNANRLTPIPADGWSI